jgi:hypothetical protein
MRLILLINSYLASSFTYVAAYSYIGCYKDSLGKPLFKDLVQKGQYIDVLLTTNACVDYCVERKFKYIAIQDGIMCFCSNVLPTVRASPSAAPTFAHTIKFSYRGFRCRYWLPGSTN